MWAIAVAIAVAGCGGTPAPGSSSAAQAAQQTATVSPTPAPTAAPSPTDVPVSVPSFSPRPAGLFVGSFAMITVAELNIRTAPSINAARLEEGGVDAPATPVRWGKTSGIDKVFILAGPVDADGYRWWQVYPTVSDVDGVRRPMPIAPDSVEIGWVAGGNDDSAWLIPANECPVPPVELADITFLVASWAVRLGCFKGKVLTLRGWLTTLPREDGDAPAPPIAGQAIFPVRMGWYDQGNVNRLDFRLHPAMGLVLPDPEQWVEVTGAFDDPTSSDCETWQVIQCRAALTVTSFRPLGVSP